MKTLETCANGCPDPPKPPSLVLCAKCCAGITKSLEEMIARMSKREEPHAAD